MDYFIPNEKMGSLPIPQPTVLNTLPVIGFECRNPTETNLSPNTINLIDTGFIINFPDTYVLRLEKTPKTVSYSLLNKYIFHNQNQHNKLIIPLVTKHFITLPKNSLICLLRFMTISDVVTFKHHGKNYLYY